MFGLGLVWALGWSPDVLAEDFAFAPAYPDHLRALRVSPAVCVARFGVREGGLPAEVAVTGCPSWLAEHSKRDVHGQRWPTDAVSHTATYTYIDRHAGPKRSQADYEALVAAHAPLDATTDRCVLEVGLSGAEVSWIRSNAPERCLLAAERPAAQGGLATPGTRCALELTAYRGANQFVRWTDCPQAARRPMRATLERWRFNAWTPWPQVYLLTVVQGGPSAEPPPNERGERAQPAGAEGEQP